jgi:ATP adenylyltransferase
LLEKLLETSREIIGAHDYNILFVKEWIIVVPRMAKSRDRVGANAAGMLGLVWLRDQQERDGWTKFGMSKHLAHLGVPIKN